MDPAFFEDINPLAARQPKTDRLILPRFLEQYAEDERFTDDASAPTLFSCGGPIWKAAESWEN